jgi:hypothetical protein
VADKLQAFVDAGANWVSAIDMMPSLLAPDEAMTAVTRSFEVAGRLKAHNQAPAAV